MFCPACGAQNPASSKFCRSCGTPFSQRSDEQTGSAPAPDPGAAPTTVHPVSSASPTTAEPSVAVRPAERISGHSIAPIAAAVLAGVLSLQPWATFSLEGIPNSVLTSATGAILSNGGMLRYDLSVSDLHFLLTVLTRALANLAKLYQSQLGPTSSAAGTSMNNMLVGLQAILGSTGVAQIVSAMLNIAVVALIVIVSIAVYRAITTKGASLGLMIPAGVLAVMTSAIWILAMLGLDAAIRSAARAGAYGVNISSPIFAPTWCVWVVLLCGLAMIVIPAVRKRG